MTDPVAFGWQIIALVVVAAVFFVAARWLQQRDVHAKDEKLYADLVVEVEKLAKSIDGEFASVRAAAGDALKSTHALSAQLESVSARVGSVEGILKVTEDARPTPSLFTPAFLRKG